MAGTISELNKEQGEIALGSQFQKDVILVIADLSEMEAQVNVDENDIVSIAIGQPAEIEVDALLDQKLNGVVSEIANSARVAGAGSADQKTDFEIKIAITSPPATLRPGMTASADIITKTNDSALSVPLQSVAVRTVDQLTTKGEKRGRTRRSGTRPTQTGSWRSSSASRRARRSPGRSRPASRATTSSRSSTASRKATRSSPAAIAPSPGTSRTVPW